LFVRNIIPTEEHHIRSLHYSSHILYYEWRNKRSELFFGPEIADSKLYRHINDYHAEDEPDCSDDEQVKDGGPDGGLNALSTHLAKLDNLTAQEKQ
jgi:hypothetical protein